MEFSDYLSLVALSVSLLAAVSSIYFNLLDRLTRVEARSEFCASNMEEDGPYSPAGILITIINHGAKPVDLEYLYFQYGKQGGSRYAETVWDGDKYGRYRLEPELGKYDQFFSDDDACIFTSEHGIRATEIYFQDSRGRRFRVKGSKRSLQAYFNTTESE
jgi:hypothetical protein